MPGGGGLLDFSDRKLERLTFLGERVFVEHWDPAKTFGRSHPSLFGVATRK